MQLRIDPEKHLLSLFPTTVGWVMIPGAAGMNQSLETAITDRMSASSGVALSNIGGWQSSADFVDWEEPAAGELTEGFRQAVEQMIRLTSGIRRFELELYVGAWANVNRSGNFNQLHTHPENTWSGVYYVRSGDYSEDTIRNPGRLHFHDPRERSDMVVHPGKGFGKPVPIAPRDGMLVLFPSWLGHSVNVFYSNTTRISIAFNAQVLKFDPQ